MKYKEWLRQVGYEEDERYCTNCEDDTIQLCKYDTHERDSSHDHLICLKCKWEYFGVSGKYSPPHNEEEDEL